MSYVFEYIQTNVLDPLVDGSDSEIVFKCEGFSYIARYIYGDVQYIHGEDSEFYNTWPIPPTEQEIEAHDHREEVFNADHSIVKNWVDSL
jgi:hypothetical protein